MPGSIAWDTRGTDDGCFQVRADARDGDGNSGGDELEYLGLRDAFAEPALVVIEWPERAEGWLPEADLHVHLTVAGSGRDARVSARTARGEALLAFFHRGRRS